MRSHVLVVDDDELMRTVGARHLTRAGHDVSVADTFAAALACAGRRPYDVAILDYYLGPRECGCDLIRPLRRANPTIRIAVLSGLALLPEIAGHARRAGADLVASKGTVDWPALARAEAGAPSVPPAVAVDLGAFKRAVIHGTYIVQHRNLARTARALGITRTSLQRMLRRSPPPDLERED